MHACPKAVLFARPPAQVNEKKTFNDRGQKVLGLVSGDIWYSQQAFRALNQVKAGGHFNA